MEGFGVFVTWADAVGLLYHKKGKEGLVRGIDGNGKACVSQKGIGYGPVCGMVEKMTSPCHGKSPNCVVRKFFCLGGVTKDRN